MPITVDPDALAADGAALTARQTIDAPPATQPAGADNVSVAAAAQLTAHSTAAALLINHAQQLRAAGGVVTQHTAASLRAVDEAAAAVIAGTTASISGVASGSTSSALSAPLLPAMPTMPPAAMATGEAQATALYTGPGAASLRQFADNWQSWAATLDDVAGQTSQTAASIDAHWSDGSQQAGAATAAHGSWLSGMAEQVRTLASAAYEAADHYDQAIAATPSPQEFTDAHTQMAHLTAANAANHGLLSSEVSAAAAQLAQMQSQATEAAHAYYTAVTTTMSAISKTTASAPSIAAGGGSAPASIQSGKGAATKTGNGKSAAKKTTSTANSAQSASSTGQAGATSTGGAATDPSNAGANAGAAATNAAANSSQLQQLMTTLLPAAAMLPMAPMSALSGLSSLSRSNTPTTAAEFAGRSGAAPDLDTPDDFGDTGADTSPASSGGVSAEAAKTGMPVPSALRPPPSPLSSASGPATSVGLVAAEGAGTAPATAEGAGASYPPMMGGHGAGDGGGQRDLRLFPDRRLVARQVPNSEAVFGELQRERRSRVKRATPGDGQAKPGEGTDER